MYINKIILDGVTYDIGPNIENTELTTSTTDVPSTNLMKTIIDEINTQINNAISRISTNETNISKLNADVFFFSGSEFFSLTWGPYYGNICRGIIPIHTKKGAKIEVISATAENESVIIRNTYAIINQYILLETERNVSGKYGQINISVT